MTKSSVLGASAVVTAVVAASLLALAVTGLAEAAPNSSSAPGAPGEKALWTEADKGA